MPSELPLLVKRVKRRKPKLLIVAGGDGTVSYVAGHLVKTGIEMGVIPLGTTNNFARSIGLAPDIDNAVKVIAECPARPVDIGMVNRRYFANVTGVGVSAEIAERVTDGIKKRYGRFAYVVTGFSVLMNHKPFRAVVADKDGELQLNLETHQLIIANGRFHAGREIAQDAKVDNRELIVFAIGGRSRLSLLWHMVDFYIGRRKSVQHSSYLIAKNIRISTDTPMSLEMDGEVQMTTPIRAKVAADAILVRCRK